MRNIILGAIAAVVIAVLAMTVFVYSGVYDIAADESHAGLTEELLEVVRERSIIARVTEIQVPDLDSAELIGNGAAHYKAMCTGCHLAPGMADTELRQGLYPTPPNLSRSASFNPARAFWIIKHGVKLTGMPAWGATHDDESVWGLVAFVKRLPELSQQEYESMTASAAGGHDHGDHAHGGPASNPAAPEGGDHSHAHGAQPEDSGSSGHAHATPGSATGVLDAFHHALEERRGDEALQYLAADVIILEGGHAQTLEEYAGGHLASDMAFLADMESTQLSREIRQSSSTDQVTVVTRKRLQGTYRDKEVDIVSSETAVLEKREGQWKIVHVHWSS